jgi:methylase of polypeptide subunit release factors
LKAYGSHASLRGEQFAMIISNPAFLPTPDDSRHDVHSGKDALLGMDEFGHPRHRRAGR